jgi:hypothetical protein
MKLTAALTTLLLTAGTVQARDLPNWQALAFQQQALWVSASSEITLQPCAGQTTVWQLVTNNSVASNREYVEIDLDSDSGRSLRRSRFSEGRQSRLKQYDYQAKQVLRERRSKPEGADTEADSWPVTGRNQRRLSLP